MKFKRIGKSRGSKSSSKDQQRPSGENKVVRHIDNALDMKHVGVMNVCRFPGTGFPDQLKCVLKYKENGISFSGTITPAAQVYRLNSCFDPNLTGTGHQPNQFDQLTALYSQYCVTAARLKVQVLNEGTVEADCALIYCDQNISTQSVENLSEARWSINKVAGQVNSGKSVITLMLPTASIANLQGEKNLNTDPNNYSLVTTNPVDPVYGIFKLSSADGITNTKVFCNFELWQDVIFKDLINETESKKKHEQDSDDEDSGTTESTFDDTTFNYDMISLSERQKFENYALSIINAKTSSLKIQEIDVAKKS